MKHSVTTPLLALLTLAGLSLGQDERRLKATQQMDPDLYCKGRSDEEFFREEIFQDSDELYIRSTCHHFYRCIPAASALKAIIGDTCPSGMFFDVEQQICELSRKVKNCGQWEKVRQPRPRWPVPENEVSNCPTNQIECGSGECLPREFFCNTDIDCVDGSDENYCGPDNDPNASPKCDPKTCVFNKQCFCSVDGTRIPGDLTTTQTPQMIIVTFSGAVNEQSFRIVDDVFRPTTKNKGNDCGAKATFFVSHAYTNYSAVQELHRRGHEIAVHSITNKQDRNYWSRMSSADYETEFDGGRLIIESFANITEGEVMGMRVPNGRVGGNSQFQMMVDWGFLYDSSLAAPRGRLPLWPYLLMHRMPHKCIGTDQNCPSRNFTVWEMVMNELDRRDDPKHDEALTGCHYVDQCANIIEAEQFERFLDHNLNHHYSTNRAPLGLHFTAAYFETRKDFQRVFKRWVSKVTQQGDYFFVTMQQAIKWMESPTEITSISSFAEWKTKCEITGTPYCSIPNPCRSKVPRLFPKEDSMYLYSCMECPQTYPWLGNPFGDNYFNDL